MRELSRLIQSTLYWMLVFILFYIRQRKPQRVVIYEYQFRGLYCECNVPIASFSYGVMRKTWLLNGNPCLPVGCVPVFEFSIMEKLIVDDVSIFKEHSQTKSVVLATLFCNCLVCLCCFS